MASEFASAREFVRGAARSAEVIYILSKGKTLLSWGIAHTSVIAVDHQRWASVVNTVWDSTVIAVARRPSNKLIVVGEDGDVIACVDKNEVERETILPKPVMICNARSIAGHVFACGMKRQVYQRVDERKWIDVSAPFPKPDERVGSKASMDTERMKYTRSAGMGRFGSLTVRNGLTEGARLA